MSAIHLTVAVWIFPHALLSYQLPRVVLNKIPKKFSLKLTGWMKKIKSLCHSLFLPLKQSSKKECNKTRNISAISSIKAKHWNVKEAEQVFDNIALFIFLSKIVDLYFGWQLENGKSSSQTTFWKSIMQRWPHFQIKTQFFIGIV